MAVALIWIVVAALFYFFNVYHQLGANGTDGSGRPLGNDFINFWSGAVVAWRDGALAVYDWQGFQLFEEAIVGATMAPAHYDYPPVLLVLTAPLVLFPYVPALAFWLLSGWYAFYRALRLALPGRAGLIAALAAPAVLLNAIGGQNGTWSAALIGGGLCLIERRPAVAGVLFGLLSYKPTLGLLLPVALLAGRQWRAFAAAAATVVLCVGMSVVLFGWDAWSAYFQHTQLLRAVVLENGEGTWHRMVSVIVAARELGANVPVALAVQGVAALICAAVVAWAWWRGASVEVRNTLLILGTCIATPHIHDYDMVIAMFAAVWLVTIAGTAPGLRQAALVSAGLLVVSPMLTPFLGSATGLGFGPLFVLPGLVVATLALIAEARGRGDQVPATRAASASGSVTGSEHVSPRQT